jgi:hypothetical protein
MGCRISLRLRRGEVPARYSSMSMLEAIDVGHACADLRVRPKTSSWITEFSQHESDGCEFQEREGAAVEIFPVLGEATAAVEPGDRAFDDPTLGQLYEPLGLRGSFDDFSFDTGQDFGERVAEDWPLIGAVGEQPLQEWKLTKQRRQQQDAAVAILNTGGMNDGVQQQT